MTEAHKYCNCILTDLNFFGRQYIPEYDEKNILRKKKFSKHRLRRLCVKDIYQNLGDASTTTKKFIALKSSYTSLTFHLLLGNYFVMMNRIVVFKYFIEVIFDSDNTLSSVLY